MTIVLSDPCDPPASLTPLVLENQSYTVTDHELSYVHDTVVADPVYRPVRYEYTIDSLDNTNTPIT